MPRGKDLSGTLKDYDLSYSATAMIAGLDEAGRGPLAGPVVAATALFSPEVVIPFVNDSKKLSEKRREELFLEIKEKALAVGVGIVDNLTIDRINILEATKLAMREALHNLSVTPDIILIDAVALDELVVPSYAITKGDAKSFAIAASSIIAKVTRDHIMQEYDKEYPGYGFAQHKGYGTKAHYEAIDAQGITPIHRKSFLKKIIQGDNAGF